MATHALPQFRTDKSVSRRTSVPVLKTGDPKLDAIASTRIKPFAKNYRVRVAATFLAGTGPYCRHPDAAEVGTSVRLRAQTAVNQHPSPEKEAFRHTHRCVGLA